MNFFKFRQKFAYGAEKWDYCEHYSETELAEELNSKYDWSDKYRGCDIEQIESPPKEWLINQIKWTTSSIKNLKDKVKKYKELVKKL